MRTLTIQGTRNERISGISGETCAHRLVIDNRALSVLAAHAGAGIHTFVSHAHQVGRAVGINDAFGSARQIRVADIVIGALADRDIVSFSTNRVRTALEIRAGRRCRFHSGR